MVVRMKLLAWELSISLLDLEMRLAREPELQARLYQRSPADTGAKPL